MPDGENNARSLIESRLVDLGLILPASKLPVSDYLGTIQSGSTLYVSARVSQLRGQVGAEVDLATARLAARDTALNLLAIIMAAIGNLDRISSILKVRGFVNSISTITAQPEVKPMGKLQVVCAL